MNCPKCGTYTLAKHCNTNERCPWFKCVTCKVDINAKGRTKPHETLPPMRGF